MDVINAKSNTYPFVEVVIYSEILRTNCRLNQSSSHLAAHIRKVCQVSYMHLRNIASIRPALTDKAAECLIHAFITSRLDCCNSLLAGLPGTTLGKLQSIQNAAARLLTGTRKYDHITPVLRELHWLPITSRIQYKVTLLVYKTLYGPAPQYLQDLIQYRSARPGLRSAGILLNVPMTRSVTYGDRAFCSIGPTWWNSLPSELKLRLLWTHSKEISRRISSN